jgi:hypothetical protein
MRPPNGLEILAGGGPAAGVVSQSSTVTINDRTEFM